MGDGGAHTCIGRWAAWPANRQGRRQGIRGFIQGAGTGVWDIKKQAVSGENQHRTYCEVRGGAAPVRQTQCGDLATRGAPLGASRAGPQSALDGSGEEVVSSQRLHGVIQAVMVCRRCRPRQQPLHQVVAGGVVGGEAGGARRKEGRVHGVVVCSTPLAVGLFQHRQAGAAEGVGVGVGWGQLGCERAWKPCSADCRHTPRIGQPAGRTQAAGDSAQTGLDCFQASRQVRRALPRSVGQERMSLPEGVGATDGLAQRAKLICCSLARRHCTGITGAGETGVSAPANCPASMCRVGCVAHGEHGDRAPHRHPAEVCAAVSRGTGMCEGAPLTRRPSAAALTAAAACSRCCIGCCRVHAGQLAHGHGLGHFAGSGVLHGCQGLVVLIEEGGCSIQSRGKQRGGKQRTKGGLTAKADCAHRGVVAGSGGRTPGQSRPTYTHTPTRAPHKRPHTSGPTAPPTKPHPTGPSGCPWSGS